MRLYHSAIFQTFIFLLLVVMSGSTMAHQMRPVIVNINFEQNDRVEILIEANAEAILSGIGSQHKNTDDAPQVQVYRDLRELPSIALRNKFFTFAEEFAGSLNLLIDGQAVQWQFNSIVVPEVGDIRLSRKSEIVYQAKIPAEAETAVWSFDQQYGDAIVNFKFQGDAEKTTYWLAKGQPSPPYHLIKKNISRSWTEVVVEYISLGFIHILPKGMDHILFVLGLFLLSKKFKPLLWQVTAFTLAHTMTLALSIYAVISTSSMIIEPLIALSIAYVGIENLLTTELKPWRIVIVFLFGLLHGMGFAGVLIELGLPESRFVTALISFNVGVELGQLSVIFMALFAVFWLREKEDLYRKLIVLPGSLGISVMGLFWTWERLT